MKRLMTVTLMFMGLAGMAFGEPQMPFFRIEAGVNGLGALNGPSAGFGLGTEFSGWGVLFGYTRDMGWLDSDKVQSNGATIQTPGIEFSRKIIESGGFVARLVGGAGYSIVDLDGRDKAENDVSYNAGLNADYQLTDNLVIGLSLKSFWLRTHVRRTDYGSHIETLSTGGEVEVVDEFPQANSLNLNSARLTASVTWRF